MNCIKYLRKTQHPFYTNSQETGEIISSWFDEASMTLISKPDKDVTNKITLPFHNTDLTMNKILQSQN